MNKIFNVWINIINKPKTITFDEIGMENSVLGKIFLVRQGLISGLRDKETDSGWSDPSELGAQSLWTCIEVAKSLIEASEPLHNLDNILMKLQVEAIILDGNKGWQSESLQHYISTYLTADAGLFFQAIGRHEDLKQVLATLVAIQNKDGGWGVCNEDKISRTRSTSFVIRLYAKCLDSPWAFHLICMKSYIDAIDWLNTAQNDTDGGWGGIAESLPSDVSATSLGLLALVSSKLAVMKHPDLRLPIRDSTINAAISRLEQFSTRCHWRGYSEEFSIRVPDGPPIWHTVGGVGTLVALQALCKAAQLGYVKPNDDHIFVALSDILERCKPYRHAKGLWIYPSDQNSSPTCWNSAFALDAFLEFQRMYLAYLRKGYSDTVITRKFKLYASFWKRIAIISISIILLMIFLPKLVLFHSFATWFNKQTPWGQGIIMLIMGVIVQQLVVWGWDWWIKQLSALEVSKKRNPPDE